MNNSTKQAATQSAQKIIESLAEVLLREGISFSEFNDIARQSFVNAAERVLSREKRITDSRVSVLTGIHRKDVKRLREAKGDEQRPERISSNRAIAVISAWTREKDYCDAKGNPLPLAYDNEAPSLTTLIKEYSGDMPVRAVCDELERMGVIEIEDNRWHLKIPVYVPNKSRNAIFGFLGSDTANLVKTITHNLNNPPRKRRFQRSVAYDELSTDTVEQFQAFASERSMDLLKEFDTWLSKREKLDKQASKNSTTVKSKKAGVGIYYFEEAPRSAPDGGKK